MHASLAVHPEINKSHRHPEGLFAEEHGPGFISYFLAYAKKGHNPS